MATENSAQPGSIDNKRSSKKKDPWEKLQLLTPILIPVTIAFVGFYFTNRYNDNQLQLQRFNDENQRAISFVNAGVAQSGLIKDLIQHLTSKDTSVQKIAIVTVLYAAPIPGKQIVDILAVKGNDNTRSTASNALADKKMDLLQSLFSTQKGIRIVAANEIISSWTTDESLLTELIKKAGNCLSDGNSSPDCDDGVYNTIIVLPSFSRPLLLKHKQELNELVHKIPAASKLTLSASSQLLNKIE
jgi:hypothetical protein